MNILKHKELTWVDIEDPKDGDITYLRTNFNLPEGILEEIIPPSQHSKIEDFDNIFYFVLYLPEFDRKSRLSHNRELDVVLGQDFLITSHYKSIGPVMDFFNRLNTHEEEKLKFFSKNSAFLLAGFLNNFLRSYSPKLDHISEEIKEIEIMIFGGQEKEMIARISNVQRNLLAFWQSLKPQRLIFESLVTLEDKGFSKGSRNYFQGILGSYHKVLELMENNIEMLNSLENTNSILFSSKLNELIKFFTVFSVLSLVSTLVFSFFGMSIMLPLGGEKLHYLAILGFVLILNIILIIYFRKKKWL